MHDEFDDGLLVFGEEELHTNSLAGECWNLKREEGNDMPCICVFV